MQKRIVVVLGMHRSGTSVITRALQVLGVELGDRLMPPIEGNNNKGFWEDLDVNALNIDLLSSLGHDWHTLTPVLPEEVARLAEGEFKLRAVEILRGKLSLGGIFGLKDPRIARVLPFWKAVFAHMHLCVSYVIASRNPMSVARSLRKRDGYDLEKGYYLWLEHTIACLVHTQGECRIVVEYDRMLEDPALQLSRMAGVLNLPFNRHSAAYSEYEGQFLETSLQHSKYEVADLALDAAVPADVAALYSLLVKIAADELLLDDRQVVEEITRQNERVHANRPALAYMRINEERVVERDKQIAEREGQIASLNHVVAEREKQLVERDGQIARLNQAVAERDRQIAAIMQSSSWRVTAPLRAMGRFIREKGRS